MAYWLFKSEPDAYSIDDLKKQGIGCWDGVRNYQARNFLRDGVKKGDSILFYHSSCAVPAIVGVAKAVKEAYPDPTQFDPAHKYHDPKSTKDKPRWVAVDVQYTKHIQPITRDDLRAHPTLCHISLLQRGQRLSILPISRDEWTAIAALMKKPGSTS
ncbi:MAG TPA: EVE domain-containing protein [Pseudomonadales bacterium]